jgi:tetratricopeptide (TPR) repeat protein
MKRIRKLKTSQKALIISVATIMVASAILLNTQFGAPRNALNEAIEGGELTITSMGRNHESLTWLIKNDNAQASQLLEAARTALDGAKAKFNSAAHTEDDYVHNMVRNYRLVVDASDVMAKGVDNLLIVNTNLTNAIDYYSQQDYESAVKEAVYCLSILESLQTSFGSSSTDLSNMSLVYVPSGQRDRLTHGVDQYRSEMAVYSQIILLLRSIIEGKDYLQMNAQLEESMRQLQKAITNRDYETAKSLLQRMHDALQALRDQSYQIVANLTSQLNPEQLEGETSDIAQELQNRLRDLEGLDSFQNYLQSLEKYLEALELYNQGKLDEAEQALNQALTILGNGDGADPELQGMYQGLRDAFSTLRTRIKGQPDQG